VVELKELRRDRGMIERSNKGTKQEGKRSEK
jgi:hypothetical protein